MDAKLDVGRVFEQIFRIYRQQFGLLIGGALAMYIPVAIVNGLLYDSGGFFLTVIANAIALVAGYLYQGMVVEAARDILDGRRDQSIGGLFRSAGAVVGTLIVVGILAGIAIAIGFVLLIIPGLFLITIWAVIVPVVVIERSGVFESFGRSRELVKGQRLAGVRRPRAALHRRLRHPGADRGHPRRHLRLGLRVRDRLPDHQPAAGATHRAGRLGHLLRAEGDQGRARPGDRPRRLPDRANSARSRRGGGPRRRRPTGRAGRARATTARRRRRRRRARLRPSASAGAAAAIEGFVGP